MVNVTLINRHILRQQHSCCPSNKRKMEEYLALGLTTTSAILFALYLYQRPKRGSSQKIPGPKPLNPSEGNFPDISKSGGFTGFLQDIHNKYGPIASFWWGPQFMVSLASPGLFKYQSKDFNREVQLHEALRPLLGHKAVNYTNGEEGKRRHKTYAMCFNTKTIKQYYGMLNRVADDLIGQWDILEIGDHIRVQEKILGVCVKAASQGVMGACIEDDLKVANLWHTSQQMWDSVQRQLRGDNHEDDLQEAKSFNNQRAMMKNMIQDACRHRQDQPANDNERLLIDVVMDHEMEEDVKTDDITNMFFGATHTTAQLLTWSLYLLGENPEMQEKAYHELRQVLGDNKLTPETFKDLVYLDQVIKETLRWSRLVPFTVRYKDTDAEIAGYHIPAKTPIVHAIGVLGHDPTYFPDPEKFDPERFSADNIKKLPILAFEPFGFAGKRKCPGYMFAMLETTIVLAEIIKAFKISLVEGQTVIPVDGLITQPAEDIMITIVKRQ